MRYDIFISFKHLDDSGFPTADSKLAGSIYTYLKARNLNPFSSEVSLEEKGTSRYKRAIDDALDECSVLVAVGTHPEHLQSEWVRYEWDGFFNDILSGIKPDGRIFTYVDGILPNQLPRALRQTQSIVHANDSLARLYQFIKGDSDSTDGSGSDGPKPPNPSSTNFFVFISGSHEDQQIINRLKESLIGAGINVFDSSAARFDLLGSGDWENEIEKKVRDCAIFIPIVSQATESRVEAWFRREWALAARQSLYYKPGYPFIIPVFTSDVTSPRFIPREFQEIQYARVDDDASMERITAAVKTFIKDRT